MFETCPFFALISVESEILTWSLEQLIIGINPVLSLVKNEQLNLISQQIVVFASFTINSSLFEFLSQAEKLILSVTNCRPVKFYIFVHKYLTW